jgi:hypothetical protein
MARIEPFHLVVVDDDRRLFSVVGPMTDDTDWNRRVCDAQDKGRQVRCYTPGRGRTREQVVAGAKTMGLTGTSEALLYHVGCASP